MVFFVMVGFPQLECFIITVMLIESLNVLFGQSYHILYVTGSTKTVLIAQDRKFDFFHTNTKLNQWTIKFHCHSRPE